MKKLLSGLMVGVVVLSSTSSLVSCSKISAIAEIYLVTDSGKILDKSFNESTYKAGNEFLQQVVGNIDSKFKNSKISKIEPENASTKVLKNQYTNAKNNGAKTILLPGFHHAIPGEGNNLAPKIMENVEQGSTIILDGRSSNKNELGFSFRGDISGFYAGMSAIIWSLKNTDNQTISLGSFGGISNPQAVDSFIVGYLASIELFNEYKTNKEGKEQLLKPIEKGGFALSEESLKREVKRTQKDLPKDLTDSSWFSQSFAQGDGMNVTKNLIQNKATVIMPVAGPQTLDVIGLSKTNDGGKTVKIVGVDTNQAEAFPQNEGMFITSAEKELTNATIAGLSHTKYWINQYNSQSTQNNITNEVGKYLENKISITRENEEGIFETVDLSKEESWEGQTLWVGGNMSSGGRNLLDLKTATNIKKIFSPEALSEASIKLFETINKNDYGKCIINEKVIKYYAKSIKENDKSGGNQNNG
ncbi:hypothetical protein [Spiroplasma endosymbiont of Atherix ibis]|uniref:hypothetical protein n=1 Tax=Spiroplasma endosymbiont of Atherix ibis TaxID=3066291 RepID=UPI0030D085D2